ncbi:WD40 repeat-like protein [Russula earlei]|uniref:WD40 repeat-like protein n=1 Tax=Russula earlei TaxID=71964 RepID=A0ACC0UMC8_9AGAM|nr:WD40 repeat-like protein [Russula earlei]
MGERTTLSVHRCRFVDFTPSSITALAFPPLPLPSIKGKKKAVAVDGIPKFGPLIVGHANGNVEISEWTGSTESVEAPQAWVVRKTLSGVNPSKVDSLAITLKYPDELPKDDIPSLADLRLFTTGGGSQLTEWDMINGTIRRSLLSNGGSIWSIAANPASTILAMGCEDGSIHLLSLEYDTLQHLRRLDRSKSRILSLAWGPPLPRWKGGRTLNGGEDGDSSDEDEDEWQDSWIVAGCSDSSLRKWDVSSGRVLNRMGTDKIRGERTLVWTVAVLGDGVIISGDSLGMVKFWDSQTCTQLQSFEAHGADVLCLAIGSDGTSVYTSGIDQKVTQFSRIESSSSKGNSTLPYPANWVRTASKRMHSHDVRGLSIWPPYAPFPSSHQLPFPTNVAPLLVSGGLDMSIVVAPAALPQNSTAHIFNPLMTSVIATFEDAYHRRIAYTSGAHGTVGLHLAKRARLVLSTGDTSLAVWRLPEKPVLEEESPFAMPGEAPGWNKVLEMSLRVKTNLVASAISDDGHWLAVSDTFEVKLFWLQTDSSGGDLKPKRVRNFQTLLQGDHPNTPTHCGASALTFSPDSSKLVVASTAAVVLVLELVSDPTSARVLRRFDQHRNRGLMIEGRVLTGRRRDNNDDDPATDASDAKSAQVDPQPRYTTHAEAVPATITRMATSPDGQWLATTDDHMRTHIFNLDAVQHHTTLPSFPQRAHALAFAPSSPSLLILGFANNTLELYDVEARQFPPWSRALCTALPKRFTNLHDAILGVTLAPVAPAAPDDVDKNGGNGKDVLALFWGATWLCKVEFAAPVGWGGFEKKRRRRGSRGVDHGAERDWNAVHNFKLVTQYRQILLADFLSPGELVVVERPLTDVLVNLPPAYYRPKYGAS